MVSLDSIVAGLQILGGLGVVAVMCVDLFVLDPNPAIHVPHIALGIAGCLLTNWNIVSLLLYIYLPLGLYGRYSHPLLGNKEMALGSAVICGLAWLGQLIKLFTGEEDDDEEEEKEEEKSGKKGKKKDK
mmetsp:Transcript_61304/g.190023  ORF Transcript_61304/g.190023 Transcript_61304/m.190023 type:complete len:129 (+) Transcript_61304:71-457(+)